MALFQRAAAAAVVLPHRRLVVAALSVVSSPLAEALEAPLVVAAAVEYHLVRLPLCASQPALHSFQVGRRASVSAEHPHAPMGAGAAALNLAVRTLEAAEEERLELPRSEPTELR